MVNSYLEPIAVPKTFMISEGIFVSTRVREGHTYFDPTCHGDYRYLMPQSDDMIENLKHAAFVQGGQDTHALVSVGVNSNLPVNLSTSCLYEVGVVHTGSERLHPGDIFVVEPPTEVDSKAQVDALKHNVRASSFQKCTELVGGYLATHRLGADLMPYVTMMCDRDMASVNEYTRHAERIRAHDSSGQYMPALSCATASYNFLSLAMQTLTMSHALHQILEEDKDLSNLLLQAWKAKHNITDHQHDQGQAEYPGPSEIAMILGRQPLVRNFMSTGVTNAMDMLQSLTRATYGRVNRAAFQNPDNDRGVTMNATDGYCVTGDMMKVSMIAMNGFQ